LTDKKSQVSKYVYAGFQYSVTTVSERCTVAMRHFWRPFSLNHWCLRQTFYYDITDTDVLFIE